MKWFFRNLPRLFILTFFLLIGFAFIQPFFNEHCICGHNPHTRSPHEMEMLAKGITEYFVDHQTLPTMVPIDEKGSKQEQLKKIGALGMKTYDADALTTPTWYVKYNPPTDQSTGFPYAYYAIEDRFILYTTGPDDVFDIQNPEEILAAETEEKARELLAPLTFSKENGHKSKGDDWVLRYDLLYQENQPLER